MNIEEAIQTAIKYEERVRAAYRDALEAAQDPIGQRVFRLLADEENTHVGFLNKQLAAWRAEGRLSEERLDTALPSPERIQQQTGKLEAALDKKDFGKELEMLDKARQVEKETSDFYQRLVSDLPPEGSAFFGRFLEIEKGHLELVQAEIDSITGLGFWFDMPEFELEGA